MAVIRGCLAYIQIETLVTVTILSVKECERGRIQLRALEQYETKVCSGLTTGHIREKSLTTSIKKRISMNLIVHGLEICIVLLTKAFTFTFDAPVVSATQPRRH